MDELYKNILDKKINQYGYNENDFKAISELTVEITLNEYRKLIQEVSTKKHDIDKAEHDKYTREDENRRLKDKVKDLETIILKYKCQFGELKDEEEEDE